MNKIITPPIKCQGIKTKIVPHIIENLKWGGKGRWIEPFLGSGVVLFNISPMKAIANDINPYIIELYEKIRTEKITPNQIEEFLFEEGRELSKHDGDHYYKIRERFNIKHNILDFLFLNRCCFNGIMRFNGKGGFNVPYNHKPDRFRQAYITKIVNQVKNIQLSMHNKSWKFICKKWEATLNDVDKDDFVYLDPPYIGRHTDYYNKWSEEDAKEMVEICKALPCNFMVSMWKQNKYRKNEYLNEWKKYKMVTINHFYHVGSKESLRSAMQEVLILGKPK